MERGIAGEARRMHMYACAYTRKKETERQMGREERTQDRGDKE